LDDAFYKDIEQTFQPYWWTRITETGIPDVPARFITVATLSIVGISAADVLAQPAIGNAIHATVCKKQQETDSKLPCSDVTAIIGGNSFPETPSRRLFVDEYAFSAKRRLGAGDSLDVVVETISRDVLAAKKITDSLTALKAAPAALGTALTEAIQEDDTIVAVNGFDPVQPVTAVIAAVVAKAAEFVPTAVPTFAPTSAPTSAPTKAPTKAPTSPTSNPTKAPTIAPTAPTMEPTPVPTPYPTAFPTKRPTAPTTNPTLSPTSTPTVGPTKIPITEEDELSRAELAGAGIGVMVVFIGIVAVVVHVLKPTPHTLKSSEDPVTQSQIEESLVRMQEV
jgi:hypothetical protein